MPILSVWINRESGASEPVYSEKENSGAVPAAVNLYKSFLKQAATVDNTNQWEGLKK
jgi:hypothetical protein